MKLTPEAVKEIVKHCLFKEGEGTSKHVKAEAVMMRIGFHPERLAEKLGIASKQAKILLPREMWSVLPGGMPYFAIGDFSHEISHPHKGPQ